MCQRKTPEESMNKNSKTNEETLLEDPEKTLKMDKGARQMKASSRLVHSAPVRREKKKECAGEDADESSDGSCEGSF